MRIIIAHNFYQQPGGEDQVFADEVRLLQRNGHDVETFTVHNDALRGKGRLAQIGATLWNRSIARELAAKVEQYGAEVVHFHNTFPLISPAAYYATSRAGAAVVQTLHNYRFICPGALLYREGGVCEKCVGSRMSLASVKHACYRGSRATTAATAAMLGMHRALGTYRNRVDTYIALSAFGRDRFVEGGLPADRIVVKPNFLEADPGEGEGAGNYALFVGRLTQDKGVETLLQAWPLLHGDLPLKIVGDGPLAPQVQAAAASHAGIEWLGRQPGERVAELMKDATCLIFPSRWYEGHPKTIVESLACGTPVIASNLGAIPEALPDGHDLFFEAGNPFTLATTVGRYLDRNEQQWYRAAARQTFFDRYTADANYRQLMTAYRAACLVRDQRALNGTRRAHAAGASTPVRP